VVDRKSCDMLADVVPQLVGVERGRDTAAEELAGRA
jgi:hypothetical protein